MFTRLIEGPYPNYEQVIPRENDKFATVDKVAMAAALRRMSIVASDQTHRIRLAFGGGMLKFSVQTPDLGEAQDEMAVTYEGDALEIGFNAAYLLELLKYMPTDEVRFTLEGAGACRDGGAGGLGRPGFVCLPGHAAAVDRLGLGRRRRRRRAPRRYGRRVR